MASRLLTNNTANEGRTAAIVTSDETTSVREEAGTSVASEQDQFVNTNSVQRVQETDTCYSNLEMIDEEEHI